MLPISINGELAVGARIMTPEIGVWIADVDLDLNVPILPAGRVTLLIGTTALIGTVDARATGFFGAKANVRVVGGGNGWDKQVRPQAFPNDFGVLSTAVISATAAEVGEIAVDVLPTRLGANYVRSAGPASRVLAGREWFVDPTGTTIVGPRPPLPVSPLVDILSWDPLSRRAELASDDIVLPGTILVDTRFGTAIVRDVEQTFGAGGARASAWCKPLAASSTQTLPGTRLGRAIGAAAIEAVRPDLLREYRYRIIGQDPDGRLSLQLSKIDAGAPVLLPRIEVWPGMAGLSALFVPGTECIVTFLDGNPAQPVVTGFVGEMPPIMLKFGTGLYPIALAPAVLTALTALQTEIAAVAAALVAVTNIAPLLPAHASAAAAATAAVGAGAGAIGAASATLPSIRVFSD